MKPGIVVTGAAGDMGRGVCDAYLADGWTVYGGDVAPIAPRPGLVASRLDVTDRAAVFALAERAASETSLQVWVNCAGIVAPSRISEADPGLWDRIIAVNLTGTFHGCAAALQVMSAGGGGRIVNVGSLSGQIGGRGMHPAYGASKAGVHALTKSYALAGARYGVGCNAVAPSVIEGSMADGLSEQQRAKLIAVHPLRRLATMDEIVSVVRFLADPAQSAYINGVTLPINGGGYMG